MPVDSAAGDLPNPRKMLGFLTEHSPRPMDSPFRPTYFNPHDGNTYFLAPLTDGEHEVLWACPTNADGSYDLDSAIPETDFADKPTSEDRRRIAAALGSAQSN